MRFVTKTIHAWLDYPVAFALVTLPFLLGLGADQPLALAISPIVGAAAFLLTVFTDHDLGVIRILPYRLHLAVDLAVGLLFLALPLALGSRGSMRPSTSSMVSLWSPSSVCRNRKRKWRRERRRAGSDAHCRRATKNPRTIPIRGLFRFTGFERFSARNLRP